MWRVPQTLYSSSDAYVLPDVYQQVEQSGFFDPQTIEDARDRVMTSIVRRQGQSEFRRQLLTVYDGKCAITDCNVREALEAAHIVPYQGAKTNHLTNGILLRADIHTLFDLHLLSISPSTHTVMVSPRLLKTSYKELNGQRLALPKQTLDYPSKIALEAHHEEFLLKCKVEQHTS